MYFCVSVNYPREWNATIDNQVGSSLLHVRKFSYVPFSFSYTRLVSSAFKSNQISPLLEGMVITFH